MDPFWADSGNSENNPPKPSQPGEKKLSGLDRHTVPHNATETSSKRLEWLGASKVVNDEIVRSRPGHPSPNPPFSVTITMAAC